MGSSVSLRTYARLGSAISTVGMFRLGSTLSIYDFAEFGSSLSVRSFIKVGSSLTLGGDSSRLSFGEPPAPGQDTYLGKNGDDLEVIVKGFKAMTLSNAGGSLHGTWVEAEATTTSDRRLKKSIMPLQRGLEAELSTAAVSAGDARRGPPPGADKAKTVSWVLRELRPVSFKFKKGVEAKYSRFGFVAQEMQQVLPSLVRGTGADDKHLSIVYQDLIALLTLAHQTLEDTVSQQQDQLRQQEDQLRQQEDKINVMLRYIQQLDAKLDANFAAMHKAGVLATAAPQEAPAATPEDERIAAMRELIKTLEAKVQRQDAHAAQPVPETDARKKAIASVGALRGALQEVQRGGAAEPLL